MIAPHDKNTIAEVNKIRNASEIKFKGNKELIEIIGQAIDDEYIKELTTISLSPEAISRHKDMKIVYTPIHGTGVKLVPAALKAYGSRTLSMYRNKMLLAVISRRLSLRTRKSRLL